MQTFEPGVTPITYAPPPNGLGKEEALAAALALIQPTITLGKKGREFEEGLASYVGVEDSVLVNSGSSANLLAVAALTSHLLPDSLRLKRGDEVITVAAGFPTTVAPIIQNGAVPVFVDSSPYTLNVREELLEEAYVEGKTKAVILAHTLGNPFDLDAVLDFCGKRSLWLIEDNCDALGAEWHGQKTGSFGCMSTQSFYPAHHISMGEGGAVNCRSKLLSKPLRSLRDWGRECWCEPACDNTCGNRFGWKRGELPKGFDHKYIYSHLGYNLKPTDIQAAIGCEQLKKLPDFVDARRKNWMKLKVRLSDLDEFLYFQEVLSEADASPFGFMLGVRHDNPFTRKEFCAALDAAKIHHRPLFGGNLTHQPAFIQLLKDLSGAYRVSGRLDGADRIMEEAVFIGVHPFLTGQMIDYMVETIIKFCKSK